MIKNVKKTLFISFAMGLFDACDEYAERLKTLLALKFKPLDGKNLNLAQRAKT